MPFSGYTDSLDVALILEKSRDFWREFGFFPGPTVPFTGGGRPWRRLSVARGRPLQFSTASLFLAVGVSPQ